MKTKNVFYSQWDSFFFMQALFYHMHLIRKQLGGQYYLAKISDAVLCTIRFAVGTFTSSENNMVNKEGVNLHFQRL